MLSIAAKQGVDRRAGWKQDPEAMRKDILAAAIVEFAADGLSGARVDDIAANTRTSKRMIHYHFGDKQGLYEKAVEVAYAQARRGEAYLELGHLPPHDALAHLVAFTFDHHRSHPDFVRMVMIENVHHSETLVKPVVIRGLNVAAIDQLAAICARGMDAGMFRSGIDPTLLHWQISTLSFFNVSNRPRFSDLFGDGLYAEEAQNDMRAAVIDMVLESVTLSNGATS